MTQNILFCLIFIASTIFAGTIVSAQQENVKEDFKAVVINESVRNMNAEIFASADQAAVKKYLPEDGAPASMSSFVLFAGNDVVLVDTGLGGSQWVKGLADLGVKPEKIKLILLTHMHGDHIGGLLDGNRRRFPNAEVLSAELEYNYWLPQDSKAKTPQLEKIKTAYGNDFSKTFEFDEQVFENAVMKIKAFNAVGHTPGHTAFLAESSKSRLLIVGDLLHAAVLQFPAPEICSRYDMEPIATAASRKRILDFAVKQNLVIGGMHFPVPNIGMVKNNNQGGYEFLPVK
ncbi:MAG: MBL fold metallo-hydrolase [Planctomycetaceae bacterium]|jgi:glyoxylase-like metal-dependent hydrolase (beta-lactamase superfamily II)|nr:MBL fold metallo-hydrolase [Planctomycetaceae bacterium]